MSMSQFGKPCFFWGLLCFLFFLYYILFFWGFCTNQLVQGFLFSHCRSDSGPGLCKQSPHKSPGSKTQSIKRPALLQSLAFSTLQLFTTFRPLGLRKLPGKLGLRKGSFQLPVIGLCESIMLSILSEFWLLRWFPCPPKPTQAKMGGGEVSNFWLWAVGSLPSQDADQPRLVGGYSCHAMDELESLTSRQN